MGCPDGLGLGPRRDLPAGPKQVAEPAARWVLRAQHAGPPGRQAGQSTATGSAVSLVGKTTALTSIASRVSLGLLFSSFW